MIDIIGNVVTLHDKRYFVIGKKEINNRELYIAVAIDPNPPLKIKIMEIFEFNLYPGDKSEIKGRIYTGEDNEALIQEYTDIFWEIMQKNREFLLISKNCCCTSEVGYEKVGVFVF